MGQPSITKVRRHKVKLRRSVRCMRVAWVLRRESPASRAAPLPQDDKEKQQVPRRAFSPIRNDILLPLAPFAPV